MIRHHMRVKKLDEMKPSKVQALKDEARVHTLACPSGSDEHPFIAFDSLMDLTRCDSMTAGDGVLLPHHAKRLADPGLLDRFLMLVISGLHVSEIRSTTRERVRKEMEEKL